MHFDFLMCSERSGSNLIAKMMNAHSEVCGPFPSHAFRQFLGVYYGYGDLSVDENWDTLLQDLVFYMERKFAQWETSVGIEELRKAVDHRSLAAAIRVFYEAEARHRGKTRLFVKENQSYTISDYLLTHFSDSRYVIVVRDPRDMAATWKALAHGGVRAGAEQWRKDQAGSIDVHCKLRDIGKSMLTTFESLVGDAENTLRKICNYLELNYEPGMLDFHKADIVATNANRMESWRDLQKPLDQGEIGKYKNSLSEAEVRYVEALCAREMEILGYSPVYDASVPIDDLDRQIPPASETDRTFTDVEMAAYSRWREALDLIKGRKLY